MHEGISIKVGAVDRVRLEEVVADRNSLYLNNRLEHDHPALKGRCQLGHGRSGVAGWQA